MEKLSVSDFLAPDSPPASDATISGPDLTRLYWQIQQVLLDKKESEEYWQSTNKTLEKTYRLLEEKEVETTNLLRIICHDLATPISVITAANSVLKKKVTDPKSLKLLEKITHALDIQKEITESVRDMQAVLAGKLKLISEPVNLLELTNKMLEMQAQKLEDKNISVEMNMNPVFVLADPNLLGNQIIGNILSNAIKFSFPNSIIKIDAHETGGYTSLEISDHGKGMPKNILNQLFDIHASTSRTGTNGEKGTGFGMPIVKTYLEKMGGRIEVSSSEEPESNHGTTVCISLKTSQNHHLAG